MADNGQSLTTAAPQGGAEAELAALEMRIRRLEDVVVVLQDTRQLEERVVERLSHQRTETAVRDSAGLILDAGKRLLPAAAGMIEAHTRVAEAQARTGSPGLRRTWLFFDILAEARTIVRMFVDPRYRLTWPARLVLPVLGAILVLSWWQLGGTKILGVEIGQVLDKVVDLLLAFVAFKVLAREVVLYREQIPDAPLPPPRP